MAIYAHCGRGANISRHVLTVGSLKSYTDFKQKSVRRTGTSMDKRTARYTIDNCSIYSKVVSCAFASFVYFTRKVTENL